MDKIYSFLKQFGHLWTTFTASSKNLIFLWTKFTVSSNNFDIFVDKIYSFLNFVHLKNAVQHQQCKSALLFRGTTKLEARTCRPKTIRMITPFFLLKFCQKSVFVKMITLFGYFAKKISSHQVWERRINQIWKFHKLNRNFSLHQIQLAKIPNYCQKFLAFVTKGCFRCSRIILSLE